jgi:hypothetical protein
MVKPAFHSSYLRRPVEIAGAPVGLTGPRPSRGANSGRRAWPAPRVTRTAVAAVDRDEPRHTGAGYRGDRNGLEQRLRGLAGPSVGSERGDGRARLFSPPIPPWREHATLGGVGGCTPAVVNLDHVD